MSRRPDLRGFDPLLAAGGSNISRGPSNSSSSLQQQYQQRTNVPPAAPCPSQAQPINNNIPHEQQRQQQYLQQQGFSSGLIRALLTGREAHPLRVWILENSAAMTTPDAHIIGRNFENIQQVTRWDELCDCVAYHSQMAATLSLQTRFALLNEPRAGTGPQYFTVGEQTGGGTTTAAASTTKIQQELATVQHVMTQQRQHLTGPTNLTQELHKLKEYIVSLAPQLRQQQRAVTIVLATQGIPTGGGQQPFIEALRAMEGLPVWIVIRLCTDNEQVFEFYNSLDAQLNLPYDVLDDWFGESLEVYLRNPWLTYALPLHRFREIGYRYSVMDAIDERALTVQEVGELCSLLFATTTALPDPTVDWLRFSQAVAQCMSTEAQQWNPVTRKMCPWINLHDLNRFYGPQQPQRAFGPPGMPQQQFYSMPQQSSYPQQQQQQYYQPTNQPQQYQQQPPPQQYQQQSNTQQVPPSAAHGRGPQQQRQYHAAQAASPVSSQQQQQQPSGDVGKESSSTVAIVKQGVIEWSTLPPTHQATRPIQYLLGTVQTVFPPAFSVKQHEYFANKWKPFSTEALASGQPAVIKRATRKMKFFLHPDKLPRDFDEKQSILCRAIWDAISNSAESTN